VPYVNKKQKTGGYKLVQVAHSAGKCMHVIKMLSNNFARNLILSRFVSSAYKKGRVVLIQSELKDHLDILASMISNQGVPMGDIAYYVGGMSSSERDYSKTKKVIMATYAMTAEATDIPQLDTLVMATPRSDVRQIVGRILREFPGKKDPVVFDIVDSTSSVFAGYYNMRYKWYKEVGAVIDKMQE
jgi:superfamily II DNA or RNA helicase